MNNPPSLKSIKSLNKLRAEAEAARVTLCKASAACEESTPAWPQEVRDALNNSYNLALAVRLAALARLNAALEAARS